MKQCASPPVHAKTLVYHATPSLWKVRVGDHCGQLIDAQDKGGFLVPSKRRAHDGLALNGPRLCWRVTELR